MWAVIKEYWHLAVLIIIGYIAGIISGIDSRYSDKVKYDKEVIDSYMNQCLTYVKENSTNKSNESPITIYTECREHTEKLLNLTKPAKAEPSRIGIEIGLETKGKENEETADK